MYGLENLNTAKKQSHQLVMLAANDRVEPQVICLCKTMLLTTGEFVYYSKLIVHLNAHIFSYNTSASLQYLLFDASATVRCWRYCVFRLFVGACICPESL